VLLLGLRLGLRVRTRVWVVLKRVNMYTIWGELTWGRVDCKLHRTLNLKRIMELISK